MHRNMHRQFRTCILIPVNLDARVESFKIIGENKVENASLDGDSIRAINSIALRIPWAICKSGQRVFFLIP
jgi:hypothetical protein